MNKTIIIGLCIFIMILLIGCKEKVSCAIELYYSGGGVLVNAIESDSCDWLKEHCNDVSYCDWDDGKAIGKPNSLGACVCDENENEIICS